MALDLSIDQLDAIIRSYAEKNALGVARGSLSKIRGEVLRQFEENDRRRGIPYLTITETVSHDYRIESSGRAKLVGDEEPWIGDFDDLDFSFGDEDSSDIVEDVSSSVESDNGVHSTEEQGSNDLWAEAFGRVAEVAEVEDEVEEPAEVKGFDWLDAPYQADSDGFDVYREDGEFAAPGETVGVSEDSGVSETSDEEEWDDEDEWEEDTPVVPETVEASPEPEPVAPTQGIAQPKKVVRRVVKRVVKPVEQAKPVVSEPVRAPAPKKQESFSDLVEKARGTAIPPVRPAKPSEVARTEHITSLRDLIKKYPNCDAKFAEQYFPRKEIEKQVRQGKVFLRAGKLTI